MSVASTSSNSGLRSPWAEQFGGCGLEARTVHVPGGMFLGRHREKEKSEFFLKKINFVRESGVISIIFVIRRDFD